MLKLPMQSLYNKLVQGQNNQLNKSSRHIKIQVYTSKRLVIVSPI